MNNFLWHRSKGWTSIKTPRWHQRPGAIDLHFCKDIILPCSSKIAWRGSDTWERHRSMALELCKMNEIAMAPPTNSRIITTTKSTPSSGLSVCPCPSKLGRRVGVTYWFGLFPKRKTEFEFPSQSMRCMSLFLVGNEWVYDGPFVLWPRKGVSPQTESHLYSYTSLTRLRKCLRWPGAAFGTSSKERSSQSYRIKGTAATTNRTGTAADVLPVCL